LNDRADAELMFRTKRKRVIERKNIWRSDRARLRMEFSGNFCAVHALESLR